MKRSPFSRLGAALRADRAATLVEYSLAVALVAVVSIGAIQYMEDEAGDQLNERGQSIGNPSESGATTTTVGGPGTTAAPTTTAAPGYTGTMSASCTGTTGDQNNCQFTLSPDPTPVVPTWVVSPAVGVTGVLPNVTFTLPGDYTVQATVNGTSVPYAISCKSTGGNLKCDKKS